MVLLAAAALAGRRVVLASGSPRRLQLLRDVLGVEPAVVPSTFAEDLGAANFATPEEYCAATARAKAAEVAARLRAGGRPFDLLVAADTVVVAPGGAVLEKAETAEQAAAMIRALAGATHRVVTALVLVVPPPAGAEAAAVDVSVEAASVTFAALAEEDIAAYAADPRRPWAGKAGGYGIQDVAALFTERLEGDFYTVMGLPLHRLATRLGALRAQGAL